MVVLKKHLGAVEIPVVTGCPERVSHRSRARDREEALEVLIKKEHSLVRAIDFAQLFLLLHQLEVACL